MLKPAKKPVRFCRTGILSLILLPGLASAAEPGFLPGKKISVMPVSSEQFRLVSRQAKLQDVLAELARQTGAQLHYGSLPDKEVAADCRGSLQKVLTCLLGSGADLAVRKAGKAEAWILSLPDSFVLPDQPADQIPAAEIAQPKPDVTERLLELFKDPSQRKDAIAALATEGRKDDFNVRRALKQALRDQDPAVRAEAVFALAAREGQGAWPDLQAALKDSNPDVRLMALESAGNDPYLLEQALQDKSETVRRLAADKWTLLNKAQHP